jgi:hypothetical protein
MFENSGCGLRAPRSRNFRSVMASTNDRGSVALARRAEPPRRATRRAGRRGIRPTSCNPHCQRREPASDDVASSCPPPEGGVHSPASNSTTRATRFDRRAPHDPGTLHPDHRQAPSDLWAPVVRPHAAPYVTVAPDRETGSRPDSPVLPWGSFGFPESGDPVTDEASSRGIRDLAASPPQSASPRAFAPARRLG